MCVTLLPTTPPSGVLVTLLGSFFIRWNRIRSMYKRRLPLQESAMLTSLPCSLRKSVLADAALLYTRTRYKWIESMVLPLSSLSPSLISLMVSVDVKHHVYVLAWLDGLDSVNSFRFSEMHF